MFKNLGNNGLMAIPQKSLHSSYLLCNSLGFGTGSLGLCSCVWNHQVHAAQQN